MSGSTALVRRSLFGEALESLARVLLVRHEWPLADSLPPPEEDTVGFAFANALPARAVLLDVSHLRFFWRVLPPCAPQHLLYGPHSTARIAIHAQGGMLCSMLCGGRGARRLGAAAAAPHAPGTLGVFTGDGHTAFKCPAKRPRALSSVRPRWQERKYASIIAEEKVSDPRVRGARARCASHAAHVLT